MLQFHRLKQSFCRFYCSSVSIFVPMVSNITNINSSSLRNRYLVNDYFNSSNTENLARIM